MRRQAIRGQAATVGVQDSQPELCEHETLLGGSLVPPGGFGVVLRHTASLVIQGPDVELRQGIAGLGLGAHIGERLAVVRQNLRVERLAAAGEDHARNGHDHDCGAPRGTCHRFSSPAARPPLEPSLSLALPVPRMSGAGL